MVIMNNYFIFFIFYYILQKKWRHIKSIKLFNHYLYFRKIIKFQERKYWTTDAQVNERIKSINKDSLKVSIFFKTKLKTMININIILNL
mgnify:CR=1 FL=1